MMPKSIVLSLLLAVSAPTHALAQEAATSQANATTPQPPTAADIQWASRVLNLMVAGMQSDNVPQATKTILFRCLYRNPLRNIATATSRTAQQNNIDTNDNSRVLGVIARVCGLPAEGGGQGG